MARKAKGVFLWAKHATDKLCRGQRRLEDIERLKRRLDELLHGLMLMCPRILDDLRPKDRKEIMNLLFLLLVAKRTFYDHELSIHHEKLPRDTRLLYRVVCGGTSLFAIQGVFNGLCLTNRTVIINIELIQGR